MTGEGAPRRAAVASLLLVVLVGVVVSVVPLSAQRVARAHGSDPAIVTLVDSVTPALPSGVVVQVVSGVAAQLVVENPTSTPLEALDDAGAVFLRISADGIDADVASPAWHSSNLPGGAARTASGPPRFVRVRMQPTWGWYDHRLHPTTPPVSDAVRAGRRRLDLGSWRVPLRYGGTAVTVLGHVEYRPVLGRLEAEVTSAALPDGVEVHAVSGRLPGLFLRSALPTDVVVIGPDDEVFARIGPRGVAVDRRSAVAVEDARAKGQPPAVVEQGADPVLVVSVAPSYSWLDPRLRWTEPAVPDDVQRRAAPTVLVRWTIPIRVGSERFDVSGTTSFVPLAPGMASATGRPVAARLLPLLGVPVLLVVGVALVRRRRTYDVAHRRS